MSDNGRFLYRGFIASRVNLGGKTVWEVTRGGVVHSQMSGTKSEVMKYIDQRGKV